MSDLGIVNVEFRDRSYAVSVVTDDTVEQFGERVSQATSTAYNTIKLLKGGRMIIPARQGSQLASAAGVRNVSVTKVPALSCCTCNLTSHLAYV